MNEEQKEKLFKEFWNDSIHEDRLYYKIKPLINKFIEQSKQEEMVRIVDILRKHQSKDENEFLIDIICDNK